MGTKIWSATLLSSVKPQRERERESTQDGRGQVEFMQHFNVAWSTRQQTVRSFMASHSLHSRQVAPPWRDWELWLLHVQERLCRVPRESISSTSLTRPPCQRLSARYLLASRNILQWSCYGQRYGCPPLQTKEKPLWSSEEPTNQWKTHARCLICAGCSFSGYLDFLVIHQSGVPPTPPYRPYWDLNPPP